MADFVPENTKRLKVLQTGPRGTHRIIFRFPQATSDANMISQARAACLVMKELCLDGTSYESAEVANEGSNIFIPIIWGAPIITATGNGVTPQDEYGRYVNFVGRSTAGSRVAFYVFNAAKSTASANNRLTSAENANVSGVVAALQDAGVNFVAIDQNPFVMKSYANTGINDAVARKSRQIA